MEEISSDNITWNEFHLNWKGLEAWKRKKKENIVTKIKINEMKPQNASFWKFTLALKPPWETSVKIKTSVVQFPQKTSLVILKDLDL